jgi:hypothetical protein
MAWLPGAYQSAEDFLEAGFAAAAKARGAALDLIFVDLELQHVGDRSVLQRLHLDIVLPARAAGVSLWLGGISLGGLLALDYAASYSDELGGIYVLAPYLGNRILTAEIAAARGVAAWQPGALADIDEERRVWRYIQKRNAASSPLCLGFGRQDRFAGAHELLASTLGTGSVITLAGGHDWPTWMRLWEGFLDSNVA